MKHKFFILLFAILASLGTIFAQSGTCGDNLTWNLTDGVLTISGTGAMENYAYVDGGFSSAPWNDYRETISSLEFQLGVTSIGEYAFYQCRHLTTVTLPSSVISIGRNAFDGCANLISATIPNSVTTIGWYAFSDCTNLSSVTIPESVTELGIWPFQHCSGLTSIDVASTNPEYSSTDGVLFYKTESSLLKYPAGKPSASYIIPDNTASISDFAFEGSTHLTSVTIPNSVTDIRSYAFRNCENLASLTIPNSVTRIGGYAFLYCTSLTSVICKAITPPTIASTAFYGVDISIPLYVPAQSLAAYQAADVWKDFGNILPIDSEPAAEHTYTVVGSSEVLFGSLWLETDVNNDMILQKGDDTFLWKKENVTLAAGNIEFKVCEDHSWTQSWPEYNYVLAIAESGVYTIQIYFNPATGIVTADATKHDSCIIASGTCGAEGDNLTWMLSCDSVLTISGTGEMHNYGNAPWYEFRQNIRSIIVEEGVTSISKNAFYWSKNLLSVSLPSSVINIGTDALLGCELLSSINVANSNQYFVSVDDILFNKEQTLLIQYPLGKKDVTSYSIPNSVTSIGESAFFNAHYLVSVQMGNGVTTIGKSAFSQCYYLKNMTLGNNVTNIGSGAFYHTAITSLSLPSSVLSIGDWALESDSLTEITVASNNPNFSAVDGVLYNKDISTLVRYPKVKQGSTIIIPNSVTSIGEYAVRGSTKLTSLDIPNNVTRIQLQAFQQCVNLNSLKIPSSVSSIENYAFRWCMNLTSVTNYATTPQTINANVFEDVNISSCALYVPSESVDAYKAAEGWKEFGNILPIGDDPAPCIIASGTCGAQGDNLTWMLSCDSVLTISGTGAMADYNWNGAPWNLIRDFIKSIIFEDGITSIGEYAFRTCDALIAVSIPNSVTSIGGVAFWYCTGLTSVTIPNSVTSIGNSAFYGCTGLTSIDIPNSVTSIGSRAFASCASLTSINVSNGNANYCSVEGVLFNKDNTVLVQYPGGKNGNYTIPNGVTSIGDNAFYLCTGLTSVTIPNSVTNIGVLAFYECTGLTSVTIPNSVTNIGVQAFYECSGLTSVTIGYSVSSIGDAAFYKCTGLTSVTIPNSVTNIGDYAFSECTGLTSVTIPNSVTSIGRGAFVGCSGLTSIDIPNSVTSIGEYAFKDCSGLTSVTIPNSVTSIGDNAFWYCTGLTSIDIPNSVTSIGSNAFSECSGLTSVTIPNSVTSIGNYAFQFCSGLTSVTNYASTPQSIVSNVFNEVNLSACALYVPSESVSAYQAADVWKEFGNILPIDSTEEVNYATLADIYNMAADSTFTLGAFDVMYVPDFQSGSNMYIKDSTGSCVIYKVNYGLQAGDHVEAGLQGKVSIYNGLHEVIPITAKEDLTITHGEAPAPMEATEVPSSSNLSQYVVYKGVSFATDTAFVEGRRHAVLGSWNGQTITFYNQYYIGATLSASKTYNITAVNTIYRTTPQAYPLAVEEVSPAPCIIASGTCGAQGDNLTWMLSCDSVLTISGTGAMGNYNNSTHNPSNIPSPWYNHLLAIKSIIIEDGVTSIGNHAFDDGCKALTTIKIPNTVTSIGIWAFSNCLGLTTVTIPSSVTSIGGHAFYSCRGLISIEISNIVTSIGDGAFAYCSSLTSVTNYATAPQTINANVFDGVNKSACTLYVPAESVEAYKAAEVWKEFGNILPIEDTPEPCIIASGTCGAQGDNLTWTLSCDSVLTISGTGAMADFEWSNAEGNPITPWKSYREMIKYISLPEGLTSIGSYAFYDCTSLTSVAIPNSVTRIGYDALAACRGLTSIDIPNSVTTIESRAFENCIGMTSLSLSNAITFIGEYAFVGCTNLLSVTIPNSLTYMGAAAFGSCERLTSIDVEADNQAFCSEDGVLFSKDKTIIRQYPAGKEDESYSIPNTVKIIYNRSFTKCSHLKDLTIPNSVLSIGQCAFGSCSGLSTITIPNSVTSIESYAFWNCYGLISVEIPASVTNIEWDAFKNCSRLSSITNYSPTPQTIEADVFNTINLSSCTLYVPAQSLAAYKAADVWKEFGTILPIEDDPAPCIIASGTCGAQGDNLTWTLSCDSVLTISGTGEMADYEWNGAPWYSNKESIKSVIIENGVTSIGDNAFYLCTGLTSVTIPNSVTNIGIGAFYNCSNLKSILVLGETPATIDYSAFGNTWSMQTIIYVPCGTIDAYKNAWSDYADHIQYLPKTYDYAIYTLVNDGEMGYVTLPASICEEDKMTAMPYDGYHFVRWSDGETMNPRPFVLTSDTTFTAEFAMTLNGNCGKDYALAWIYNPDTKTLTISGRGELTENYTFRTAALKAENIVLNNGMTAIGASAFEGCNLLNEIVVPASVTAIWEYAFSQCSNLESITILNGEAELLYGVVSGCQNLKYIEAPASILRGLYSDKLKTVKLNGGEASENISSLSSSYNTLQTLNLGKATLEYMPYTSFFSNFRVLKNIVLPENLTKIDYALLADCYYIESIIIPAEVTEIADRAFEDCRSLASVEFAGDKVQRIGDWAFYNCHELNKIDIPEGVTEIGKAAFYGCSYAQVAHLPASVQVIGDNAFAHCSKIAKMEVNAIVPPTVEDKTFYEVSTTAPVYVPENRVQDYKDHPVWSKLNIVGNAPLGVDNVQNGDSKPTKVLVNGQILILRGEKVYTVTGEEVR